MKTILVVDDSASLRTVIRMTLEKEGYTILEAPNGEEGLKYLDGRSIGLIITDLNMPVMNGLEFTKKIRVLSGYSFTPVLMLTTEISEDKKQQGKAAGVKAWMPKPFASTSLIKAVKVLG